MRAPFTGAVLTGGRSRRMGRDKALVEVGGRPMAAIAADALRDAGAGEVLAVGGDADALGRLGLTPVPDGAPGEGPLGGILTALDAAGHDVCVVLACDLPRVTAAAVGAVVDALGPHDASVPFVNGRLEVLLAAYHRRCRPALAAAFAAGERAPHRALAALDVVRVTLADARWAANANTPADLLR